MADGHNYRWAAAAVHGRGNRGQSVSPPPIRLRGGQSSGAPSRRRRDQGRRGRGFRPMGQGGRVVAFAGRARFDGVNSGVGERTGDERACRASGHEGGRRLRGRDPSGAEPPALSCVANGRLRHMLIGLRPRLEVPTAPSRWTCSATPCGPRASTTRSTFYPDFASGLRDDRPGLDSCLRALRKDDMLVVWKTRPPRPRPARRRNGPGKVRPPERVTRPRFTAAPPRHPPRPRRGSGSTGSVSSWWRRNSKRESATISVPCRFCG